MILQHVISLPTMADLKLTQGAPNLAVLLLGRDVVDDDKGGFYMWMEGSAAESLTYMETVLVDGVTTGYWRRLFLKTRIYPQGIMVSNGIIKTLYGVAPVYVNNSSEAEFFMTTNNTVSGTALFTNILSNTSTVISNPGASNDLIISNVKSVSADLKSTIHTYARGGQTTLGATLLGLVIPGFRNVSANTQVRFTIVGT